MTDSSKPLALPQAVQTLNSKDKVERKAFCPVHEVWSSASNGFLGPVEYLGKKVWEFKCSYLPHKFYAIPDRTAPKTTEEVALWIQKQQLARLQKLEAKRQ